MTNVAEAFVTLRPDLKGFGAEAEKGLGTALKAGALVGVAALAGIGAASIKMAADFDKGMREVNTIAKLSEGEFKALEGQVLNLSKEMGVAVPDAVNAVYEALGAGVPADNVVEFLRVSSAAAIGGATDLATVVDGLTSTLNAYGLGVEQAAHVSDVMFSAVNYGKLTMQEFAATIANVAPIASASGVSIEETSAAIAAMTAGGTDAATSTALLRDAISSVLRPTDELTKVFNDAGYESAGAAIKAIGLVKSLDLVKTAANGDVGQLQKLMGTIGGVQATLTLTGAQAGTFNKALDDMMNNSGQAQAAFEEMNKSASRQWVILKSQLNVAMIQLGSVLLPLVTSGMKAVLPHLKGVLDGFSSLVRYFAETIRTGELLNDGLDDMSPALESVAVTLARVGQILVKDFKAGLGILLDLAGALDKVVGFVSDLISPSKEAGERFSTAAHYGEILGRVIEGIIAYKLASWFLGVTREVLGLTRAILSIPSHTVSLLQATWTGLGAAIIRARLLLYDFSDALSSLKTATVTAVTRAWDLAEAAILRARLAMISFSDFLGGIKDKIVTVTQKVVRTGDDLITDFTDKVQKITQQVVVEKPPDSAVDKVGTQIGGKIGTSILAGIAGAIGGGIATVIGTALEGVSLAAIGTAAAVGLAAIAGAIVVGLYVYFRQEIFKKEKDFGRTIGEAIGKGAAYAVLSIPFLVSEIIKTIKKELDIHLPEIKPFGAKIIEEIGRGISEAPDFIGRALSEFIEREKRGWQRIFEGVIRLDPSTFFAGLDDITLGIPDALSRIDLPNISTIMGTVARAITDPISAIKLTLPQSMQGIVDAIVNPLGTLQSLIPEKLGPIPDIVRGALSPLTFIATEILTNFQNIVGGLLEVIVTGFRTKFEELSGIKLDFSGALSAIEGLVSDGIAKIEGFVSEVGRVIGEIPGVIEGVIGSARTAAENLGSAIGEGLGGALKGAINVVISGVNRVLDFIRGIRINVGIDDPTGITGGVHFNFSGASLGLPSNITPLATGMPFVPYDNFPALLHKGERVLTAAENRNGGGAPQVNFNAPVTILARDREDAERGAGDMAYGLMVAVGRRGYAL